MHPFGGARSWRRRGAAMAPSCDDAAADRDDTIVARLHWEATRDGHAFILGSHARLPRVCTESPRAFALRLH